MKLMSPIAEQLALKRSWIGTICIAALGIGWGIWIGSGAVLFDGLFSTVSIVMTGLAFFVSKLVARKENDRFQFGYFHIEPLANLFNGIVITLICLYAISNSVVETLHGGQPTNFGAAMIFAVIACLFCAAFYAYTAAAARKTGSELLRTDSHEWMLDGALTASILVGFGLGFLLERSKYAAFAPYVDPLLTGICALLLLVIPLGIIRRALRGVLLIAPPALDEKIRLVMHDFLLRHGFHDYCSHVAVTGRATFVDIDVIAHPDHPLLSMGQLDQLREEIVRGLDELGAVPESERWFTISFVSDRKWV